MPYVEGGASWPPPDRASFLANPEGFGTWPFGEEWLWEAIATSYLPLLDVLGRAPVTLSLTPVLCDQLEAPGAHRALPRVPRRRSGPSRTAATSRASEQRRRGCVCGRARALGGRVRGAAERLKRPARRAARGARRHAELDLVARRTRCCRCSSSDDGSRAPGPDRDRLAPPAVRRVGWRVLATRVRARAVARRAARGGGRALHLRRADRLFGLGDAAASGAAPDRRRSGAVADRPPDDVARVERAAATRRAGVPGLPRPDGAPPPRLAQRRPALRPRRRAALVARARAGLRRARVRERVADGGVCVCALDTELLGHWWYEGVAWLGTVLEEADAAGARADDARRRARAHEPVPRRRSCRRHELGRGRRPADLERPGRRRPRLAGAGRRAARARSVDRPGERALRELLALQSSDWAFLATRGARRRLPARARRGARRGASSGRCSRTIRRRAGACGTSRPVWRVGAADVGALSACQIAPATRSAPSGTSGARRASGSPAPGPRRPRRSSGTSAVTTALSRSRRCRRP